MAPKKGKKLFHNPETKQSLLFYTDPGEPWVKGRPPWQKRTPDPEQYRKASETKRIRMETTGHTEAELEGYKKLSKTRLEGDYSPTIEVRKQISKTLTGRPQKWEENKSRASCRRGQCDSVYLLKVTLPDGTVFGKWGSSKLETFKYREKEFRRKGFSWETVYWEWFGEKTEDVEAFVGRKLSQYPAKGIPHFFGHTETFEWTEQTQNIVKEIINGLEESSAS